jgi:hypothetical protein
MPREVDPGVILVIEDAFIRKFLSCALARAGFLPVEMEVPAAADFVRSGGVPVKALITNKPEVCVEWASGIPLVYTTSCPDPDAMRGFTRGRVLQKPFHAHQLLDALNEVGSAVVR